MKQLLLNIADKLDKRVKEFVGFPRTQATDARREAFTDLSKIFREEIELLPEIPEDLDARIHTHCTQVIAELLGDPKEPAKPKPTVKKGGKK